MSKVSMNLNEVDNLKNFLEALSDATNNWGIEAGAYDRVSLQVNPETVLHVRWDKDLSQYVIDDYSSD